MASEDTTAPASAPKAGGLALKILFVVAAWALLFLARHVVAPHQGANWAEDIAYTLGAVSLYWAVVAVVTFATMRGKPATVKAFGIPALVAVALILYAGYDGLKDAMAADPEFNPPPASPATEAPAEPKASGHE